MPKHILLLTTPFRPNIGGVETHLDDLITEGERRNIKFSVITYQPLVTKAKGKTVEKFHGSIIFRIPWIRINLFHKFENYPILEFIYLFPGLFVGGFIFSILNLRKFKTIHSQGLVAGVVGVALAKIFRKKVIISTHSIYNFPQKGFYRKSVYLLFKNSDKILTLSEQSRKEVIKLGIEKEKVSVFTYWIDQDIFRPLDKFNARTALKIERKKFICLFVGRLVAVKGIEEMIAASKITKSVSFLIAGDGPMRRNVEEAAKKIKNIIFVGPINNDKLPIYYNAADVLLIPSTHEEGFGRVILEALSCGIPVIGSKRGAIPEAMDETVGKIIDITPQNIHNALVEMQKKNYLTQLRKNAVKFARRRYSAKNIDKIIKYYV